MDTSISSFPLRHPSRLELRPRDPLATRLLQWKLAKVGHAHEDRSYAGRNGKVLLHKARMEISDRPDESGLSHPTQAKWDEVDIIRARGMGVKFYEC